MERNTPLDFYRGFFALLVAIGHYFHWQGDGSYFPLSFILSVDFFFILSGVVLSASAFYSNKSKDDYFIFFIKNRIFRLLPVYFILILPIISIHYFFIDEQKMNALDLFRVIFLLNVFPYKLSSGFVYPEPLGVAWSISVEFWLGLVYFPLFFLLKRNLILILIFALPTISFLILYLNVYSPDFMNVHYHKATELIEFAFIRCLIGFLIGTTIFILVKYRNQESGIRNQESGIRNQESGIRNQESGKHYKLFPNHLSFIDNIFIWKN